MQPGHVPGQNGARDDGHGQLAQHAARSLPADQPRAAFPRPDLPGKKLQTGITQNPGKHAVIAHVRIVSQAPGLNATDSNGDSNSSSQRQATATGDCA